MVFVTDLARSLQSIGLEEYAQVLQAEGFDTWHQLLDITEHDMVELGIKLGHRRRLQRAIQEAKDSTSTGVALQSANRSPDQSSHYSSNSQPPNFPAQEEDGHATRSTAPQKRKYRRHPKPDENAPERPPSAYVIFSNRVRERLKGQELSFTEIAKMVGEQWQDPDPEERAACERQAQSMKETYYSQLTEYKRTADYHAYQVYLTDFKAKHGDKTAKAEAKRSKTGSSTDIQTPRSNSDEGFTDGTSPRVDGMSLTSYTPPSASSLNDGFSYSHIEAGSSSVQANSSWPSRRYSMYGGSTHSSASYSTVIHQPLNDAGLPLRQQGSGWMPPVDGAPDGQSPLQLSNSYLQAHGSTDVKTTLQLPGGMGETNGSSARREAGVAQNGYPSVSSTPFDYRDRLLPPLPALWRNPSKPDPLQSSKSAKFTEPLSPVRPDVPGERTNLSLPPIWRQFDGQMDGES